MRAWRVVVAILGCLLFAGTAAAASDPAETRDRRGEVVALVLAQDPRFAALPDWERQWIKQASEFSFEPTLSSGYYRVLPTAMTQWSPGGGAEDLVVFDQPRSWLVEVMLVRDCGEIESGGAGPIIDPCTWRHAWYYRVLPDDTVTLLFEEGDPDRAPTG